MLLGDGLGAGQVVMQGSVWHCAAAGTEIRTLWCETMAVFSSTARQTKHNCQARMNCQQHIL